MRRILKDQEEIVTDILSEVREMQQKGEPGQRLERVDHSKFNKMDQFFRDFKHITAKVCDEVKDELLKKIQEMTSARFEHLLKESKEKRKLHKCIIRNR